MNARAAGIEYSITVVLNKEVRFLTLRRVHRWLGTVLAVFIGVIALSGTVLQLIMTIYGDTGPMQAPGEPFWVARLRDLAVTIHTGAFAGMGGVYFSLLCALALLIFTVTGGWMYLRLQRARAAQGRNAVFWSAGAGTDATVRALHRWITVPIALFTLLLAITGGSLDLYFAWDKQVPSPPPRMRDRNARPVGAQGGGAARDSAEERGRLRDPREAPEPDAGPPGKRSPFGTDGPRGPGGEPPGQRDAGRAWHDLSLTLHKLNFLGRSGQALGVAVGLALSTLAFTGGWMVVAVYRQRLKVGKRSLLW